MGGLIENIGDRMRYIFENPPLSPGSALSSDNREPLLLRYLPLLILMSLFWPVLATLVAAMISVSSWLFWLAVGAAYGFIQLIYVCHNFIMIGIDIMLLVCLKSFAMLRSFVRNYFYKMADATGLNIKGSRTRTVKRRRRKDWREEVDKASTYAEFQEIKLLEPDDSSTKQAPTRKKNKRNAPSESSPEKGRSHVSPSIYRKRNIGVTKLDMNVNQSQGSTMNSPMRKNFSVNDLNFKNKTVARANGDKPPMLRRTSSHTIPLSESQDEDDAGESSPKWQRKVKDDLGMTGSMIVTTLARLKEARLQASNGQVQSEQSSSNDCDADREEETENSRERKSFNITSFHDMNASGPPSKGSQEDYSSSLKTLLSGIVKRNHLSIDDFLLQDARSVAERGQHSLKTETRETIDRYGDEVEKCIRWIAEGPVFMGSANSKQAASKEGIMQKERDELSKRYTLLKRMKQNMGHTALMLSGGGAISMYHLGTVKALIESGQYEDIHVISGTSGGSITAAMCAIKKPSELLEDICIKEVSTDYVGNGCKHGEMKAKGVSWFPDPTKMASNWMKTGLVMDSKEFLRCCLFYYSDYTFEEAFEMTGKHVCITVSASRASSGSGVQRLLLNHISTPNVTLASAVAASCAVPGIMAPAKLMVKDSRGKQSLFEVDGVEWIDGSVQADLPFKRISTLFNISNFVVAQTNFHVVPFLNKAHHPNINTLYWKVFSMSMRDVQSRVINLSELGLFPRFFGQDLSKMFKQKYFGKLTLVPRFTTMQVIGLKALSNPTVADMENYLASGQAAAWPFLRVLKEMLRFERAIDLSLSTLDDRLKSLPSSLPNDDIDSLSISSVLGTIYRAKLPGLAREAELLREKVRDLEQENKQLRDQNARLQRNLGIHQVVSPPTLVSVAHVEEDRENISENNISEN